MKEVTVFFPSVDSINENGRRESEDWSDVTSAEIDWTAICEAGEKVLANQDLHCLLVPSGKDSKNGDIRFSRSLFFVEETMDEDLIEEAGELAREAMETELHEQISAVQSA
jgi:hypothetical protein